jgi:hypothetical protein
MATTDQISGVVSAGPFGAQDATGAYVDFTEIPSWAKKLTVNFSGVSTNGTNGAGIRLGTSAGIESTGYLSSSIGFYPPSTSMTGSNFTTGFFLSFSSASDVIHGSFTVSLVDAETYKWVCTGNFGASNLNYNIIAAGGKTLAGVLDRVRILCGGSDTFDAGVLNVLYE